MQIQNRGTLAGNICTASPAGDGVPNLLALDAERRARQRQRAGAWCRLRTSSPAIARRRWRRTRLVTAILVPKPAAGCALDVPQARRAQLSGDLHRHGGGRDRDRRGRAHRRRRLPSAPARPCRSACRRSRSDSGRRGRRGRSRRRGSRRHLRAVAAHRRHPRLGRLSPPRGARCRAARADAVSRRRAAERAA